MGEEVPKLYANKPKKAQLKHVHELLKQSGKESSSPLSAAARSYTMGTPPPQPPPPSPPPKESFARRFKFLWPLLLTVNLAVGAYLFMRTKKSISEEKEVAKDVPSTPASTAVTGAPVSEKHLPLPDQPFAEYVKTRKPIPQEQQRELLKWILEEKRKIKPKDSEEKKRIDEEKALIKQYIRAKSIPTI